MRLVERTQEGRIELCWMWLPHWLATNRNALTQLEQAVAAKLVGLEMTDATLDLAHDLVADSLQRQYPDVKGLRNYLDSLKFVSLLWNSVAVA